MIPQTGTIYASHALMVRVHATVWTYLAILRNHAAFWDSSPLPPPRATAYAVRSPDDVGAFLYTAPYSPSIQSPYENPRIIEYVYQQPRSAPMLG